MFRIAQVKTPILGAEFFNPIYISVNKATWSLAYGNTELTAKGITSILGGARGVMVIFVGNGHGDASSNPGRDWLHKDHMLHVFERLAYFGLKIDVSKCNFAVSKLNFLGHVIDEQGITPVPEKLAPMQNFPQATSLRQLRRFLGLVNYYRRFIPGCSRIITPLTNIQQKQKYNNKEKVWLPFITLKSISRFYQVLLHLRRRHCNTFINRCFRRFNWSSPTTNTKMVRKNQYPFSQWNWTPHKANISQVSYWLSICG